MIIIDVGILLLILLIFFVATFILILKRRSEGQSVQPTQEAEVVPEPVEEEVDEEEKTPEAEVVPEPVEEEVDEEEKTPEAEVVPEPVEEKAVSKPTKKKKPKKIGQKRKRITPPKRGGRSRDNGKNKEEKAGQPKQYQSRPEIVCWQRERVWHVGVEVPEDSINEELKIFQNGVALTQDEFDDFRWVLKEANVPVELQYEKNVEYSIPLNKEYLLFKLSGRDLNNGCCVRSPSFGSYLVIIPETWSRDVDLSGPPPLSPQPVSFRGYQGHFFNILKGESRKMAFRNETEEFMLIESEEALFEIVGNNLNDYSEKLGPLFGDGPISIKPLNSRGWADVSILVIGEEGKGRGRWRTEFAPEKKEVVQELPSEVMSRQGGWYFIRVYNMNDDLIESLDFRFISGLKDINIFQPSIFPSEEGHNVVNVKFSHDSKIIIKPKVVIEKDIEISYEVNTTTLKIPPRDIFDETSWVVGPHKGPQVEVSILIERIWWGIGNEEIPPPEGKDKLITLSRDDFSPTSSKTIYLKFPKPRWITNAILVGFEYIRAQTFSVPVDERRVVIPLRSFGDASEVEKKETDAFLKIWINRGDKTHECTIISLPSNVQCPSQEGYLSIEPVSIGYGRKRRAIARATLIKGSPRIIVNDKPLWEYFDHAPEKAKIFMQRLLQIEDVSKALLSLQVQIKIVGGGPHTMQQAKAATHALARALMYLDPDLERMLRRLNDFGGVRVRELPTQRKR